MRREIGMAKARTISRTTEAADHTAVLVPVVLAALLGSFLLFGTGFSVTSVVHNAAHDARHSFAFPCH
jgi:cobalt transporter subunit CbtB